MRNLILATVALASLAAPLAAQAYPGEIRDDQRNIAEQREQLRDAYRSGNPRAIEAERRDTREAYRELKSDTQDRRDDRRDWRDDRRGGDYRRDGDHRRDGYRDDRRAEWRAERRYDAGRFYYPPRLQLSRLECRRLRSARLLGRALLGWPSGRLWPALCRWRYALGPCRTGRPADPDL